ncbi:hypothetical protein SAMN06298212_10489 [Ruaniaceae bacterium KH17]|nr:hypothetical protein SAMN06298212_10489 [Ruaniaceae bacterium KH17]
MKLEALQAARFDDAESEQWRHDIIEWLSEAAKTKSTRQPSLYLGVLDQVSDALNGLPTSTTEFRRFVGLDYNSSRPTSAQNLAVTLRGLPLPAPKEIPKSYIELLEREIRVRTERLDDLSSSITETEAALQERQHTLESLAQDVETLRAEIDQERANIASVSETTKTEIDSEWTRIRDDWDGMRQQADAKRDAEALDHIATLAATTRAAEVLAQHAAGSLKAADWNERAKRERRAAQWIRAGALAAFLTAAAVGWFIVSQAINSNFDLTIGDGILRSSIAVIVGAFGGLLLRESGRHFREADTAEDVALSLKALAPFYAGSLEEVQAAARAQVGDAVLVKNVLSRFAHRDAAKHAGEIDTTELPSLVEDATKALNGVKNVASS